MLLLTLSVVLRCEQEGSPCEEAAADAVQSADQHREGRVHAHGAGHQGRPLRSAALKASLLRSTGDRVEL